jgi:hypothetical protein
VNRFSCRTIRIGSRTRRIGYMIKRIGCRMGKMVKMGRIS